MKKILKKSSSIRGKKGQGSSYRWLAIVLIVMIALISLTGCKIDDPENPEQETTLDENGYPIESTEVEETSEELATLPNEITPAVAQEETTEAVIYVEPESQKEFLENNAFNQPVWDETDGQTVAGVTELPINESDLVNEFKAKVYILTEEEAQAGGYTDKFIELVGKPADKYVIRYEVTPQILMGVIAQYSISETVYGIIEDTRNDIVVQLPEEETSEEVKTEEESGDVEEKETSEEEGATKEGLSAESTEDAESTESTESAEVNPIIDVYVPGETVILDQKVYDLRAVKSLDGLGTLHGMPDMYITDMGKTDYESITFSKSYAEASRVLIYEWQQDGVYYSLTTQIEKETGENGEEMIDESKMQEILSIILKNIK